MKRRRMVPLHPPVPRQQVLVWQQKKFVALTQRESEWIRTATEALWEVMNRLGELCFDATDHLAYEHHAATVELDRMIIEMSNIRAAYHQAMKIGIYRDSASSSDDNPPF